MIREGKDGLKSEQIKIKFWLHPVNTGNMKTSTVVLIDSFQYENESHIIGHWCDSRMKDCGHADKPGCANSMAASLCLQRWKVVARTCSQSWFTGSSMNFKPGLPHLWMLCKMCLAFLQPYLVWFYCVIPFE